MVKSVERKIFITDILKSSLISVIVGTIFLLLFAILLNYIPVSETVVTIANQAIKIISIALGCFLGVKEKKMGIVKGAISGLVYAFGIFLISGIINKGLYWSWGVLLDVALASVIGAICGILSVNFGKK